MKFFRCSFKRPKTKKNMSRACLPFIVAKTKQEADEIINGNIPFIPAIFPDKQREIKAMIPSDLLKAGLERQIESHQIYDLGDLSSKILLLGSIQFSELSFVPIDSRWRKEGDYAIVILKPLEFIDRIRRANGLKYPNLKLIEEGAVIYDDRLFGELESGFSYNPFVKKKAESWKNEIAIISRIKDDVSLLDDKVLESVDTFCIDRLDNQEDQVAICIPIQDLVRGYFPQDMLSQEITNFLSQFVEPEFPKLMVEKITVFCNVQEVSPREKWINEFNALLGDDWIPITEVDRAPESKSIPILTFRKIDGTVIIKFHTNHIEVDAFHGVSFSLKELLNHIEKNINTRFAGVSVAGSYNLGNSPKNDGWGTIEEKKSCIKEGISYGYFLTKDSVVRPDIFGYTSINNKYWRFEEEIADRTSYLWYGADEIDKFCDKAEAIIEQKALLLCDGDILKNFHGIS